MALYKRTPDECFSEIKGFSFKTNYISNVVDISSDYSDFQIAYIDENKNGKNGTILCIHGHPTWSFLWRHLIPVAIENDYRIISLDLPGFGKSDKPLNKSFFVFNNYINN